VSNFCANLENLMEFRFHFSIFLSPMVALFFERPFIVRIDDYCDLYCRRIFYLGSRNYF
jgi:hypothetical protein